VQAGFIDGVDMSVEAIGQPHPFTPVAATAGAPPTASQHPTGWRRHVYSTHQFEVLPPIK
jgi:hypothetical protein